MDVPYLAFPVDTQIDYFQIESVLGKSEFGITYKALDTQLGRYVVIKELLPYAMATRTTDWTVVPQKPELERSWKSVRERFLAESRLLASFSHPAVVGVQRVIEAHGTIYLVVDFVDGESYETRLQRIEREPDSGTLLAVFAPILDGLLHSHARGLLHRSIKPANIRISMDGQPVLIDFGIARTAGGPTMRSLLTPGYSSIEQYKTKQLMGPWTDIYAVGATMCRAMTGEPPPLATERFEEDEFLWLADQKCPGFAKVFREAVDWAVRVQPQDRPQRIVDWVPYLGLSADGDSRPVSISALKPIPPQSLPHDEDASRDFGDYRTRRGSGAVEGEILVQPEKSGKRPVIYTLIAAAVVLLLGLFLLQSLQAEVKAKHRAEKIVAEQLETVEQARKEAETARQEVAAVRKEAETAQQELVEIRKVVEAARKSEEIQRAAAEAALQEAEEAKQAADRETEAAQQIAEEKKNKEPEPKPIDQPTLPQATVESPFENSLGMKFVPVPGTKVLFSIWETRVKDYEAFAQTTKRKVEKPEFSQTSNEPATNIDWDDAKSFCAWLTQKERQEGKISGGAEYRLPTDEEWSIAVGLPPESGRTPKEKSGKIKDVYPWGTQWPPPIGVGNYDPSLKVDSFQHTSPVDSFPANKFGLFDMGGNERQWCEDWYDEGNHLRVLRGSSWEDGNRDELCSSYRYDYGAACKYSNFSFRCVLASVDANRTAENEKARKEAEEKRVALEKVRKEAEEKRLAGVALPQSVKERPFENSLGMKFVPVPGTKVLFSIWETRVKDYAVFAQTTQRNVEKPNFKQTSNDPVVRVSWDGAIAFCAWLTQKERRERKIPADAEYRLPTDEEWSIAVGLPPESGETPLEKHLKVKDFYPWGMEWPPSKRVGNYGYQVKGESYGTDLPGGKLRGQSLRTL